MHAVILRDASLLHSHLLRWLWERPAKFGSKTLFIAVVVVVVVVVSDFFSFAQSSRTSYSVVVAVVNSFIVLVESSLQSFAKGLIFYF